jgi:hypothetical protein
MNADKTKNDTVTILDAHGIGAQIAYSSGHCREFIGVYRRSSAAKFLWGLPLLVFICVYLRLSAFICG